MKKNYFKVLVCLLAMAGVFVASVSAYGAGSLFYRRNAEGAYQGRLSKERGQPPFCLHAISIICVNMLSSYVVI